MDDRRERRARAPLGDRKQVTQMIFIKILTMACMAQHADQMHGNRRWTV
jgi:hypothetical protein